MPALEESSGSWPSVMPVPPERNLKRRFYACRSRGTRRGARLRALVIAAGSRLGPYEVLSALGAGGMGEVYRAKDTRLARDVAIKVLLGRVLRKQREGRALRARSEAARGAEPSERRGHLFIRRNPRFFRRLRPPHPRHGAGRGRDAAPRVSGGAASGEEAPRDRRADRGRPREGARGRHRPPRPEARERHGLPRGLGEDPRLRPREADGGVLAGSLRAATASGTVPGMVMGTVGYMSPEQASGKPADFRSDQFSLGTILYELATGRRAFQRDSAAETLVAVIREEPEPIAKLNPRLPAPLRWIVERCLAKDADGRYASTRDLARDLATLRDHLSEAVSGEIAAADAVEAPAASFRRSSGSASGAARSSPARFAPDGRTVDLRRGVGRRALPALLDAAREPGVEPAHAAGRRDPLDLAHGPARDLPRAPLGGPLHLERHARAGAALGRGAARAPRERALGRLGTRRHAPRRRALRRGQDAARISDRQGALRDRRAGSAIRASRRRATSSRSSTTRRSATTRAPSSSWTAPARARCSRRTGSPRTASRGRATEARSGSRRRASASRARSGPCPLDGKERLLVRTPGELTIQDASADGRILMTSDNGKVGIIGRPPGSDRDRDLSLLDWSLVRDLSPDGKLLLFDETGEGGGARHARLRAQARTARRPCSSATAGRAASRRTAGGSPRTSMAPGGRTITLLPMKAGEPRTLPTARPRASTGRGGSRTASGSSWRRTRPERAFASSCRASRASRRARSRRRESRIGFFPVSPDARIVVGAGTGRALLRIPASRAATPNTFPASSPRTARSASRRTARLSTPTGAASFPRTSSASISDRARSRPSQELMPPDPAGRRGDRLGRAHARRRRRTPTATTAFCRTSSSWRD